MSSNDLPQTPGEDAPAPAGAPRSKKKTAPTGASEAAAAMNIDVSAVPAAAEPSADAETAKTAPAKRPRQRTRPADPVAPEANAGPSASAPAPAPDAGADAAAPEAATGSGGAPQPALAGDADAEDDAPVAFDDLLSGRFDQEASAPAEPSKRVLLPQAEQPKLHKVLAQAGLGSRLEMEQLILQGRISVNNQPAHVGQRIQFGDQVKVNGRPIKVRIAPPPARVLAYHKPVGEVVTRDDPQNRPTVFRKLPRLQPGQGKWQSVGRLDLNTEGLLLFTNSGELANRLMHPRFGLEREYAVRVLGALSDEEKQRLLDGVQLDDGVAQFGSIKEEGLGEGANQWYRVTISEGRNREVRRMIESVGHAVSRLIRIRYGAMLLPRGLRRGSWMELGERDIRALGEASGTPEVFIRGGRDPEAAVRAKPRPGRGDRGRGSGPRPNMVGGRPLPAEPVRGPGSPRRRSAGGPGQQGASGQPDPLRTSLGYIGADSYARQRAKGGGQRGAGGAAGPRGKAGSGGRGGSNRGGGRRG